jgi:hypothetical protein
VAADGRLHGVSNDPLAIFAGAAVHYERGKIGDEQFSFPPGSRFSFDDIFMWTVDGSVQMNSFSVYAAFIGQHTQGTPDGGGTGVPSPDMNNFGAMIQAGYNIADKIEPFEYVRKLDIPFASRLAPGQHTMTIVLDYGNKVKETFENDNQYTFTFQIGYR